MYLRKFGLNPSDLGTFQSAGVTLKKLGQEHQNLINSSPFPNNVSR